MLHSGRPGGVNLVQSEFLFHCYSDPYMIAQDRFATVDPVYWYFWIGLFMVLAVIAAPGGVLGVLARARRHKVH